MAIAAVSACLLVLGTAAKDSPAASSRTTKDDWGYTAEENASYERGATAYYQLCHVCHGEDGTGAPIIDDPDNRKLAPPLSGSRRLLGRPEYVITALLTGITGPVDEENYQGSMVSMASYTDSWIADVASYVRNSFENQATMITPTQVHRMRQRLHGRTDPLTIEEILSTLPMPLTNQVLWKATASHNSAQAPNAVRPKSAEPWTSGMSQTAGMWFQIELPEPISLWDFNLAAPLDEDAASTGFPRRYKVQVSMDGSKWSEPLVEGEGRGPYTLIGVGPVPAKVIRLTLTGAPAGAPPWIISRTQILKEGVDPASFTRKPIANPFE